MTDYYVRKSGNDANNGLTATTAKLTLAAAFASWTGGDRILLGTPGASETYHEGIDYLNIPSGLDDSHHTTLEVPEGATVVLDGTAKLFPAVCIIYYSGYVTIKGNLIFDAINSGYPAAVFLGGDAGGGYAHHLSLIHI